MKKISTTSKSAPAIFRPTLGGSGPATGPNMRPKQIANTRKAVSQHGVMHGSLVRAPAAMPSTNDVTDDDTSDASDASDTGNTQTTDLPSS